MVAIERDEFSRYRIGRLLDGYIQLKVPGSMRRDIRLAYCWEENGLTLSELRPALPESGWHSKDIVHFRLNNGKWAVCMKRKGAWSEVPMIPLHGDFEHQLEQVELDRHGLFWGE
ncbi:DUF3024 domain-containing protein [Paenibacillus sp. D9]|uniref:DUF3024 domain-containing protein n=1 Tax=Paenibacillus sp. D9 TaxID=665792 RepID=UPI000676A189|nr:DUF3024 domain-containing protein [Paenibacillus sp. D9]